MSLPRQLDFQGHKPRGIPTECRSMKFSPQTSIPNETNGIIKISIPSVKGYWNPYKSYIRMEVQVTQDDLGGNKYGALQVDNSASSFINEMILSVDNHEVERIQEYDTIAAMLNDINYRPSDRQD